MDSPWYWAYITIISILAGVGWGAIVNWLAERLNRRQRRTGGRP